LQFFFFEGMSYRKPIGFSFLQSFIRTSYPQKRFSLIIILEILVVNAELLLVNYFIIKKFLQQVLEVVMTLDLVLVAKPKSPSSQFRVVPIDLED